MARGSEVDLGTRAAVDTILMEMLMEPIAELLEAIEKRPGMYFGSKSLVRLKAFLDGWLYAKGLAGESDARFLRGFQEWIQERYQITSSHSWADIIGFFETDDVAAFYKAMALFKEYSASLNE